MAAGKRLNRLADRLESGITKTVNELSARVLDHIIDDTPVDTGRARGNWFAQVGSPHEHIFANHLGDAALASTDLVREKALFDRTGRTNAGNQKVKIRARRAGEELFISNNLPYIGRLNEGYSAQAPSHYVQKAIMKAASEFDNVKVLK